MKSKIRQKIPPAIEPEEGINITELLCLRLREILSKPINFGTYELRITFRAGTVIRYDINRLEANLVENNGSMPVGKRNNACLAPCENSESEAN